MSNNFAAILHGPLALWIEEVSMPHINEHEVLIQMKCVGICGSDVKLYSSGRCGADEITEPIIIGHEGAGVVVNVGSNVRSLKVGDRVAVEPTQPCRSCPLCRKGRYNLCHSPRYCSSMGAPGNLCTYYKHVPDFCHKIPDNVSMEEGAAVQPLAIAIHACNRANIKLGSKIAILGAGPIGILCAMAAKAMGATTIVLTDVVQYRLDKAAEIASVYTILTEGQVADHRIAEKIVELLGDMPDVVIDACGNPQAQRVALTVCATGGTVVVVGIGAEKVELPLTAAMLREVDIKGSFRIVNTYQGALAAVSSGTIPLHKFITHHFPLSQTKQALELAKSGGAMKIIIHLQK